MLEEGVFLLKKELAIRVELRAAHANAMTSHHGNISVQKLPQICT